MNFYRRKKVGSVVLVVVATFLLLLLLSLLLFLIPLIDAVNRRSRSITVAACNINIISNRSCCDLI